MDQTTARPLAAHIWTKDPDGFYIEPQWVDERLFEVEPFVGTIMDPACGTGTVVEAARAVGYQTIATDIVDRGYEHFDGISDFLCREHRVANIVCNPPYPICRKLRAACAGVSAQESRHDLAAAQVERRNLVASYATSLGLSPESAPEHATGARHRRRGEARRRNSGFCLARLGAWPYRATRTALALSRTAGGRRYKSAGVIPDPP